MQYTAVKITLSGASEEKIDMLIALLDSLDFEGVTEQESEVVAYIPTEKFDRNILELTLAGVKDSLHAEIIEEQIVIDRNWNELWEKNFEPVIIDNRCIIKAPFHENIYKYEFELIIEPKMAFGTGHHETTSLMISAMLEMDLKNKIVLDMGCGTGVLGMLAAKKGAKKVYAIDNDKLAYDSCIENAYKNGVKLEAILGGVESIPEIEFDVIFANINRNILIEHAPRYIPRLGFTSRLILSGFLEEDIDLIEATYNDLGLTSVDHSSLGMWQLLEFVK